MAPKARFSSLDVAAVVSSLRGAILGYRIANIYDISPRTYLLKLQKSGEDSKLFVLIESGVRVHLTKYARDKGQIPSGFTIKLRKHVRSRRIEAVRQLGTDRVLVLTCGSGAAQHTLLIELYPQQVDALNDAMGADENLDLTPDMPLIQLKQILETHFDWAIHADYDCEDARYWFWYQSAEKEEPRLGVRGEELGEEKELALAIAPTAQRVYRDLIELLDEQPRALTVDLVMAFPEHMRVIRRIQTMAATVYGEIRANLWHRDMKPMHLLRAKLSFLGAHRFDPRGDRWVRVTFFQGAPLLSDYADSSTPPEVFDDWGFPVAPAAELTAAMS